MSNEQEAGWTDAQYRSWQKKRQRGLMLHILLESILRYGVPIFAANYVLRRSGHMVMDTPWWIATCLVLLTACIAGGAIEWFLNEKQYRIVTELRRRAFNSADSDTASGAANQQGQP